MVNEMMNKKGDCARHAQTGIDWSVFPTLQGAPQQSVQLRVDLSLLLQHVEQQLVLGGAVDLGLLQPALHHLQLGLLLRRLQTLTKTTQQTMDPLRRSSKFFFSCLYISETGRPNDGPVSLLSVACVVVISSIPSFVLCCWVESSSSLDQLGFIKSNLI